MTVDKIADVISEALIKKGWLQAGSNNNVLIKNNVLFVYHKGEYDVNPKRSFSYDGKQMTTNCRPVLLSPTNCSWHLERFGWLLDKGNIQAALEDLYGVDPNSLPGTKAILDDLVERVDTCACKSDVAIKSLKQHLTTVQTKKVQYNAVDTDKPLDKKTYFKAVGNPLPEPLYYGKVYYIQDYDSVNFYCDAMNNSLNGVKRNGHFTIPVEIFLYLAKEKFIVPCAIEDSVEIIEDTVWLGLEGTTDVDFPECLNEFNIPKEKHSVIAQAFHDSLNITLFLNPKYSKDSIKILYDFKDSVALGEFANLDCDSNALQELLSLRSQGYSIDSLKDSGYSAEYIKAIYNESFSELRTFETELSQEGFSSEQIKELLHLYFDGIDVTGFKNVKYSAQVINMLAYTSFFGSSEICNKYQEDLMNAGSDYEAVSRVQAKYATYFNNKAEQIVRSYPKVESEDSKISGRLYFNDNNKNLLISGYGDGRNTANLRHMPKGTCVICGKLFSGLGIHDVHSCVSICMGCTDENNYVDFEEFVLCDFGG